VRGTDSVLQSLYLIILELYGAAAARTYHVVVMFVAVGVLIMPVLLPQVDAPQQTALDEQRQRAVDARPRDPRTPAAQAHYDVLRLEVVVSAEHLTQYRDALRREP